MRDHVSPTNQTIDWIGLEHSSLRDLANLNTNRALTHRAERTRREEKRDAAEFHALWISKSAPGDQQPLLARESQEPERRRPTSQQPTAREGAEEQRRPYLASRQPILSTASVPGLALALFLSRSLPLSLVDLSLVLDFLIASPLVD